MSHRKYKHIKKTALSSEDIASNIRVNQAYQDAYGTDKLMNSPMTLDVDEQDVTVRRSAFPSVGTQDYFYGKAYNTKKSNMRLSRLVSAKGRENLRPQLQPGQLIDPEAEDMPNYRVAEADDTHMLLYVGAFVIGIVIITSIV